MLNVCVLSRYLSPVVEMCSMLNVCVLSRYLSPVVEVCYMLKFVCVVLLSWPSSRGGGGGGGE